MHIFLTGLDGDFEQVQGEILRKYLVYDLEECYAIVRREALRQATIKSNNHDTSSMVA